MGVNVDDGHPNLPTGSASDVQHASIGVEHGFLHHFRECRMREDGMDQLLLRGFEIIATT